MLGTGHPFFGHQVVERVGTVFVAAEGRPLLPNQFAAAMAKASITDKLPIAWMKQPPDLTSADGLKLFVAQLKALDQRFRDEFSVRLGQTTIDTVAASFGMKSEDDNAEATKVCNVMRTIGDETTAVTTGVHHYGKNPESGLRGASAWRGSADNIVGVLADIDQLSGRASKRELVCVKARDGEQGPISPFDLEFIELGLDADGEIYGSCCVLPTRRSFAVRQGRQSQQETAHHPRRHHRNAGHPRNNHHPAHWYARGQSRQGERCARRIHRRYVTAEADPLKAANTKRMAFKRALDRSRPPTSAQGRRGCRLDLESHLRSMAMKSFRSPEEMLDAHELMFGEAGRRCAEVVLKWATTLFAVPTIAELRVGIPHRPVPNDKFGNAQKRKAGEAPGNRKGAKKRSPPRLPSLRLRVHGLYGSPIR